MSRAPFFVMVALTFVPRATWPQGNPAGPEFRINTFTTNPQESPSVASDASGNFVVVWSSVGQEAGGGIFGQRYTNFGAPLGTEFRVNTYTTTDQGDPAVASDAAGNFIAVWASELQDGSSFGVFGQRYASTGAPLGPEFRVNTYTPGVQAAPSIALDSSGNFVVVWHTETAGSYADIFGQRYANTGAPLGAEFRVNTYTTGAQLIPAVASDASGNFVVIWTNYYGSYGVFGQRYASTGAPLGTEFRVNTSGVAQARPAVDSDASGNFVVVWSRTSVLGPEPGIFGQRYAQTGAPVGPEFLANTNTTAGQSLPAVASDASGNFVVVWGSYAQDGSHWGTFGQRYASTGSPVGPEFRVNTYTTNLQYRPAVASDDSGDFVVVWQSDTQDGSSTGVFGQRYRPLVPVDLMQFGVE